MTSFTELHMHVALTNIVGIEGCAFCLRVTQLQGIC